MGRKCALGDFVHGSVAGAMQASMFQKLLTSWYFSHTQVLEFTQTE